MRRFTAFPVASAAIRPAVVGMPCATGSGCEADRCDVQLRQTLYVTEGRGLVQARGQQITELNPGDVVFAPNGEEHWHGASPDRFMMHLSITEGAPHWGSHVTDAEYQGQHKPGK